MAVHLQHFPIAVRPPFSLRLTARVLQRMPANYVDRWESGVYCRLIPINGRCELLTVTQTGDVDYPVLEASCRAAVPEIAAIQEMAGQLLGATIDLRPFYELLRDQPPLEPLAVALRGLKPPRFLSLFEALVNAICCQQINLTVGILLMNRVAMLAGTARVVKKQRYFAFPTPEQVAAVPAARLRELGLSNAKAAALVALGEGFATGRFSEEEFRRLPNDEAVRRLEQLPGVGAWSARYALLRGFGRLDVFPSGDVGAARTLGQMLNHPAMTPDEAVAFASHWKQFAGLLYFHLLGNRYLPEPGERLGMTHVPVQLPLG